MAFSNVILGGSYVFFGEFYAESGSAAGTCREVKRIARIEHS